jgi:hypothetical protein
MSMKLFKPSLSRKHSTRLNNLLKPLAFLGKGFGCLRPQIVPALLYACSLRLKRKQQIMARDNTQELPMFIHNG